MTNIFRSWLETLLILFAIPIMTAWDSLVGVPVLSIGFTWIVASRPQSTPRVLLCLYLGWWMSWWLVLPWWQTSGLILLLMLGQGLIQNRTKHYQLISMSYLLGSIVVASLTISKWMQPIGIWTTLAWLTVGVIMLIGWWWVRRSLNLNSGTSWYVQ